MRFLLTGIYTALSARLRSVRVWAALLLLPLLAASVVQFLPAQESVAPVEVGVCLKDESGQLLWQRLQQRSSAVIAFTLAEEDQILRNVASGHWDCGLILAEDFDQRLKTLDTDGIITLRISAASVVYPLVREVVSASMAELASPCLAREYLLESRMVPDETALEATGFSPEPLGLEDRVLVRMSTPDGSPLEPMKLAQKNTDTILSWVISAVILVWMMLCATDLGHWMESGAAKRMLGIRRKTVLMLSRIGADALLAWTAGSTSLLILGLGPAACAAMLGYVLFWVGAAALFAHLPGVWNALPVCMPFSVVVSLLLSPVLVDAAWFLPGVSALVKLLPVRLFLDACAGGAASVGLLCTGAALCLTLSFRMDKKS